MPLNYRGHTQLPERCQCKCGCELPSRPIGAFNRWCGVCIILGYMGKSDHGPQVESERSN